VEGKMGTQPLISKFEFLFLSSLLILAYLIFVSPLDLQRKICLFVFLSVLFTFFTLFSSVVYEWETKGGQN